MAHPLISNLRLVDMPVSLDNRRAGSWRPPPTLGLHTDAVLGEIGLSPQRIDELKAQGIIA